MLAIATEYKHHAKVAGYKYMLKYINTFKIFGIDERKNNSTLVMKKYKFLYEIAAKLLTRKNQFNILHILYGEEYYRISNLLFKSKPIVVTFHQPPKILKAEILKGNTTGRLSMILHKLNVNRFNDISAAIVLSKNQKDILSIVMDPSKIHVIPHGLDFNTLNEHRLKAKFQRKNLIITVGNWKRDYNFYFKFIEQMGIRNPDWKFVLVNKVLPKKYYDKLKSYKNVEYLMNVSDKDLYDLYLKAKVQFLPFIEAAANNSINESLVFGCPVISNGNYPNSADKKFYISTTLNVDLIENSISNIFGLNDLDFNKISDEANMEARQYDWVKISDKTIDVYKSLLQKF